MQFYGVYIMWPQKLLLTKIDFHYTFTAVVFNILSLTIHLTTSRNGSVPFSAIGIQKCIIYFHQFPGLFGSTKTSFSLICGRDEFI